ncbi:hypothetical protein GCM10011611_15440 [Aliidongia dinghuensis]|uniref:Glycosyl transferase family 1 domain-containing protein n=1 Tax=Aliidongia dinghuensis TaxID=1867774 RepID=A0A8J3E2T0_9PROT|nr:glycosyltransferase family 4 protein [Aliidongia dinghuensis]GGF10763.1 hypothetical protein GCM10011611_15440 [Aliidongia dinghuensis]
MTPGPVQARRLKILIVPAGKLGPQWAAFRRGGAEDLRRVLTILAERGIDAKLIDPFDWPWNPFAGGHTLFRALDPLRALRILLFERRVDVVVAYFESSALLVLLLRRLFRFKGRVVIHDVGLTEAWRLRERLLDFVIPRADGLVLLGSNQVAYVEKRWPAHGFLQFLPADVDLDFYEPEAPPQDGAILSIGDDAARDFATLLEASRGIAAPILIKSSGVRVDRAAYPNVTVLSRRLPDVEYRRLLAEATLVVVPLTPAIHASGVTTLVEAMAMGKALIVSDSPGIQDYVVPDETCLLVPCGDTAALRAAIQRLIDEPETRVRLGANARRFAERHLSPAVQAEVLEQVFRHVIAAGPAG